MQIKQLFNIIVVLTLVFAGRNSFAQEILTWQDCLREAGKNHPDLISAEENVKESQATRAVTASGLLPQVSADASIVLATTFSLGVGMVFGLWPAHQAAQLNKSHRRVAL